MQSHLDTLSRRICQRQSMLPGSNVGSINIVDALHHSNNHISHFRQRKLLSNADAWPTIEGQVSPLRTSAEIAPSLGSVFLGVIPPDIFTAVHDVDLT